MATEASGGEIDIGLQDRLTPSDQLIEESDLIQNCSLDGNVTCEDDDDNSLLDKPEMKAALIGIYSLIFVCGMCSNALILVLVITNTARRSVTNVFISNLACADILMCVFSVLFTPVNFAIKSWPLGLSLCKLIPMSCGTAVFVISWTSTLIAVERYCAIVHPHMRRAEPRHALAASAVIWLVSSAIMVPVAIHHDVVDQDGDGSLACREDWGDQEDAQRALAYTYVCMALQYIIPSCVMAVAYREVLAVLARRLKAADWCKSACLTSQRERLVAKLKQTHRITKTLVIMIASFMLCWIPLNVFNLLLSFNYKAVASFPHSNLVFLLCHLIASCSPVINAVLYAGCNSEFLPHLLACRNTCLLPSGCASRLPKDRSSTAV